MHNVVSLLTIATFLFLNCAQAETRLFEKYPFESKIMQETLDIYVQLPLFYNENSDYHYPVIYVLDAPVGLTLTAGVLDPLVGYNNAPQMIIVGLSTSNRARDFTPSVDLNYEPDSGGADQYLRFIRQEIVPYIDDHYRTENFRIVSGHSYGGLLVMHAFYSQGDLFQAYFAYSPSLFWDENATVNKIIDFLQNTSPIQNFS